MRSSFGLSLSLVTIAACSSSAPPPSTVRARITSDLGNVLHESKNASDATTSNLPTGTGSQLLSLGLGSSPVMARALSRVQQLVSPRSAGANLTGTDSFDPDAAIAWLNDNLFTDANSLGDGVYQVPPDLFCTTTSVDSSGNTVSSVDPDCVSRVTTADLRVRVEDDGSKLRFAIQVDANHDEPLAFALSHTSVAVTIDLDGADRAMIALAQAFGDQAPNVSLAGQITGELDVLGTAHAKLALTIDRDVAIAVADQGADLSGDAAVRFTSAKAQVLSIEADANAPLLAVDLGVGETTLHVPGDAASSTPSTDADLAGLTANATFDGTNVLTIDNISLGNKTTTISKDGAVGVAIDLNPADGRSLTATLATDAAGEDTIAVSPKLDLNVATNHAVLGDTADEYDVTRVLLDGSLASLPGSSDVRVASGTYAITTSPAQFGFTATAGQCVTATDTYDANTGNDYTAYSVGACN